MKFILARDRTFASVYGHAIEFKKGVPTFVPPVCYEEVQSIGAVPEEDLPEPPQSSGSGQPPSDPTERAQMLEMAIEEVVRRGVREQFTAGGAPHHKALSTAVGWSVTVRERDLAWQKFRQGKDD